jgi:fucose 4-O-acetylase-like acetyltransferase
MRIAANVRLFSVLLVLRRWQLCGHWGIGAASAVIGLCLLVSGRFEAWGVLKLITPAGRQTLTLYIAHILLGMGTLEALGMLGGQTVATAFSAALLFCLAVTIYAFL